MEQLEITFAQAVQVAAEIGTMSAVLDKALLDRVIADGEAALESGVIDPIDIGATAPDLRKQVEFMKVFRAFRHGVEPFFVTQDPGA